MIKQNIVFVENKSGSLQKVTRILAENHIDIYGFACFDAPEFALFRMVCSVPEKAEQLLTENGYMNRITNVIAVDMKDKVGGLDELLAVVGESNVNLDYIYTSYHREAMTPVMILQCEEIYVTESVLKNNGFTILNSADELYK
ncbi:MAG: amino acid-binding protein [Eubacteriales bacterium]|nr:amino acid-binding protein [Eubacteriales bacterium]